MNAFLQRLAQRPPSAPIGTWIMSASPLVAEAIGHAGFEWGVIDMEHTPLDMMDLIHMLQAVAGTPLQPVVRIPWNDSVTMKRVLDAGATTVLVPFVQNADEARVAAQSMRYPPQGTRGMAGMSRASRFGTRAGYATNANADMALIVQLETPQAAQSLEAIAAVEGVDALFLGPADMSASMGLVGQPTHPDVLALFADCVARAHACGKPIGTVGGNAQTVAQYRAMGFDFCAVGSDLSLMMRQGGAELQALRNESAPAQPPKTESGY